MLVVKSVPRAVRSKSLFAALSVLLMIAATLFGANVASGDEVWNQSYPRGSQSEECVAQPGETPWQTSWGTDSSWKPSWALWANEGQGGWVCNRSITWAKDSVLASSSSGGSSSVTYAVGDTGPGGGLVFLISGGQTYEMAPKAWGANETTGIQWCSDQSNSVTTGTAVGDGSANTTAMLTSASPFVACTSSAPNAVRAYDGGGFTDWFLPSKDELNAMCYYSRNLSASPDPTDSCYATSGTSQDGTFAAGSFGFASAGYWSSSQHAANGAWYQSLGSGDQDADFKYTTLRVRPVRAF